MLPLHHRRGLPQTRSTRSKVSTSHRYHHQPTKSARSSARSQVCARMHAHVCNDDVSACVCGCVVMCAVMSPQDEHGPRARVYIASIAMPFAALSLICARMCVTECSELCTDVARTGTRRPCHPFDSHGISVVPDGRLQRGPVMVRLMLFAASRGNRVARARAAAAHA
jgi:hypothetical protein